eukprot:CAMPEP_0195533460 /NCGR_PEP_ID=MMETSP0794_2-20130614/40523_1 /TAXON_ID=515487 /ORGANISM="Stephanopyxis turris, Strain CCMP 815" /LENGTH=74 /DNA_ID=CAMNT_0040665987 /DNA_START=324 /DNA_END=545 /DNA_ORIENTATION=+
MAMNRDFTFDDNDDEVNLSGKEIDLAVNLVQSLSDDVMKLADMEIYAPSTSGQVLLASTMVYDDAPWLSKNRVN